ncbi:hypothetical protein FACS1894132_12950 [Clostridia bacterium]|nr:hypothetical protein FACS1894132_12950 [Clostridia bacterium]
MESTPQKSKKSYTDEEQLEIKTQKIAYHKEQLELLTKQVAELKDRINRKEINNFMTALCKAGITIDEAKEMLGLGKNMVSKI